jgi:hypothetical protein
LQGYQIVGRKNQGGNGRVRSLTLRIELPQTDNHAREPPLKASTVNEWDQRIDRQEGLVADPIDNDQPVGAVGAAPDYNIVRVDVAGDESAANYLVAERQDVVFETVIEPTFANPHLQRGRQATVLSRDLFDE